MYFWHMKKTHHTVYQGKLSGQFSFAGNEFAESATREHGGAVNKGKRKAARPFNKKKAIHLVLRSSRARGKWSFLAAQNKFKIEGIIGAQAKKWGIVIYKLGNSGNHLHIAVRAHDHACFKGFLRTITGLVARAVTGSRKGNPVGKFWDELAYTRLLNWGREFDLLINYVKINILEGKGLALRDPHFQRMHFPVLSG